MSSLTGDEMGHEGNLAELHRFLKLKGLQILVLEFFFASYPKLTILIRIRIQSLICKYIGQELNLAELNRLYFKFNTLEKITLNNRFHRICHVQGIMGIWL